MAKHSVLVARFPYKGDEKATVSDFLVDVVLRMRADPRVGEIHHGKWDDTPITMTRNLACKTARELKADWVLMVDNDMRPDLPLAGQKHFWPTSWNFALRHPGPCVVAAPYCGPPPQENVYIFRWADDRTGPADRRYSLAQYARQEAAVRAGIEEVAALPTGLMLFPTCALDRLPLPWFDYEWADEARTRKGTTEDVYFTRNLSLAGVPVYCNWDSWAGHWKQLLVEKPQPITSDEVGAAFREALLRPRAAERMVDVPEGGVAV